MAAKQDEIAKYFYDVEKKFQVFYCSLSFFLSLCYLFFFLTFRFLFFQKKNNTKQLIQDKAPSMSRPELLKQGDIFRSIASNIDSLLFKFKVCIFFFFVCLWIVFCWDVIVVVVVVDYVIVMLLLCYCYVNLLRYYSVILFLLVWFFSFFLFVVFCCCWILCFAIKY